MSTSLPQSGSIVFKVSADDLSLADGAAVGVSGTSPWIDSINSISGVQATGIKQPIFKTNQLNGKPCVRFDGSNDFINWGRPAALTAAVDSKDYSVLIICRHLSAKATGAAFSASAGGNSFLFVADGALMGRFDANTTHCAAVATNTFAAMGFAAKLSYPASSAGSIQDWYMNGTRYWASDAAAPNSGASNFCAGAVAAGTLPSNVDIFDIIVWSVRLTQTEMFQATAWAYEKYAQTKPWAAVNDIKVFDGNSLTVGVGATNANKSYPYLTAQALGLSWGQWTMTAVGGITVANMTAKLSEWSGIGALLGKGMKVAAFEYYNSRGSSAATIETNTNTYAAAVRAIPYTKLALGTLTSFSGDNDAGTNQTKRQAVSDYYDINYAANSDAYVPLHLNSTIGIVGAYAAGSATYWSDTVHFKDAGYAVLAPLFTAGIQALPNISTGYGKARCIGSILVSEAGATLPIINGNVIDAGVITARVSGNLLIGLDGTVKGTF